MLLGEAGEDGGNARVNEAQRDAMAAVAPKLEIGAARGGHPVLMRRLGLGSMARGVDGGDSVVAKAVSGSDT